MRGTGKSEEVLPGDWAGHVLRGEIGAAIRFNGPDHDELMDEEEPVPDGDVAVQVDMPVRAQQPLQSPVTLRVRTNGVIGPEVMGGLHQGSGLENALDLVDVIRDRATVLGSVPSSIQAPPTAW